MSGCERSAGQVQMPLAKRCRGSAGHERGYDNVVIKEINLCQKMDEIFYFLCDSGVDIIFFDPLYLNVIVLVLILNKYGNKFGLLNAFLNNKKIQRPQKLVWPLVLDYKVTSIFNSPFSSLESP